MFIISLLTLLFIAQGTRATTNGVLEDAAKLQFINSVSEGQGNVLETNPFVTYELMKSKEPAIPIQTESLLAKANGMAENMAEMAGSQAAMPMSMQSGFPMMGDAMQNIMYNGDVLEGLGLAAMSRNPAMMAQLGSMMMAEQSGLPFMTMMQPSMTERFPRQPPQGYQPNQMLYGRRNMGLTELAQFKLVEDFLNGQSSKQGQTGYGLGDLAALALVDGDLAEFALNAAVAKEVLGPKSSALSAGINTPNEANRASAQGLWENAAQFQGEQKLWQMAGSNPIMFPFIEKAMDNGNFVESLGYQAMSNNFPMAEMNAQSPKPSSWGLSTATGGTPEFFNALPWMYPSPQTTASRGPVLQKPHGLWDNAAQMQGQQKLWEMVQANPAIAPFMDNAMDNGDLLKGLGFQSMAQNPNVQNMAQNMWMYGDMESFPMAQSRTPPTAVEQSTTPKGRQNAVEKALEIKKLEQMSKYGLISTPVAQALAVDVVDADVQDVLIAEALAKEAIPKTSGHGRLLQMSEADSKKSEPPAKDATVAQPQPVISTQALDEKYVQLLNLETQVDQGMPPIMAEAEAKKKYTQYQVLETMEKAGVVNPVTMKAITDSEFIKFEVAQNLISEGVSPQMAMEYAENENLQFQIIDSMYQQGKINDAQMATVLNGEYAKLKTQAKLMEMGVSSDVAKDIADGEMLQYMITMNSNVNTEGTVPAADATASTETIPDTPVCCAAMTAQCLACGTGQTVEEYCAESPNTDGCTMRTQTGQSFGPAVGGMGMGSMGMGVMNTQQLIGMGAAMAGGFDNLKDQVSDLGPVGMAFIAHLIQQSQQQPQYGNIPPQVIRQILQNKMQENLNRQASITLSKPHFGEEFFEPWFMSQASSAGRGGSNWLFPCWAADNEYVRVACIQKAMTQGSSTATPADSNNISASDPVVSDPNQSIEPAETPPAETPAKETPVASAAGNIPAEEPAAVVPEGTAA